MSKHISNPTVASAWQDEHLLQYFKPQQLANRCLPRDFILTAKCCVEEGKPGQRSEARADTQTQTKKCYSWTLVFLQHPSVSSVAVGNLTSTLKLKESYVFAIAAPCVWINLQKTVWYFRKTNKTFFPMALLLCGRLYFGRFFKFGLFFFCLFFFSCFT